MDKPDIQNIIAAAGGGEVKHKEKQVNWTTSPTLRPPPHIYGDEWERSPDPWHKSAFPANLAHVAPDQSDTRKQGWMAIDSVGNAIGFVPDGTKVVATPKQMREMKPDLQDALMRIGADTASNARMYES